MRPQDIFNEIVFIVSLDRLKEKKKMRNEIFEPKEILMASVSYQIRHFSYWFYFSFGEKRK